MPFTIVTDFSNGYNISLEQRINEVSLDPGVDDLVNGLGKLDVCKSLNHQMMLEFLEYCIYDDCSVVKLINGYDSFVVGRVYQKDIYFGKVVVVGIENINCDIYNIYIE